MQPALESNGFFNGSYSSMPNLITSLKREMLAGDAEGY